MLSEGGLRDGEERDQPMEEDSTDAELLSGYQWLLQDLSKLPLFDSVRAMTSSALQQVSSADVSANDGATTRAGGRFNLLKITRLNIMRTTGHCSPFFNR